MMTKSRGKLPIGSEWYISGGFTKVRVVGHSEETHPLCRYLSECIVLQARECSKFYESVISGKVVVIINKILYPEQRLPQGKISKEGWKIATRKE